MRFLRSIVGQIAGLLVTTGIGLGGEGWEDAIGSQGRQMEALRTHADVLRQRQDGRQRQRELLVELSVEVLHLKLQMEQLRGQVHDLQSDTRGLEEEFARYRERYRSSTRIEAVGEQLPELTTAAGKHFRDVTIKKVTDAGLVIWHQDGTTRVIYNDLPRRMRDRFQWDEGLATAQLEEEAQREIRRDQYLARQRRVEAEKRKEQENRAAIDRRIAVLEQQLQARRTASTRTSPLDTSWRLGATRPFGTGSIYRYRTSYGDNYWDRYSRNRYSSRYHRPTVRYYPVYNNSSCRSSSAPRRSAVPKSRRTPTRTRVPVSSVSPTIRPR